VIIMFVSKCWFDIHLLSGPNSLKGNRHVIKSLKELIWNRFRVSVAEVGSNELWQRAELGIAYVTNTNDGAEKIFTQVLNFLDSNNEIEIIDHFHEVEKLK
jgi:uncharacterized protein